MEPEKRTLKVQFPNIEWDYGDDINDYEFKEFISWNNQLQYEPINLQW